MQDARREPAWRASRTRRWAAALIPLAAAPIIRALGSTFRWRIDGAEHLDAAERSADPPIIAFWHGRILPGLVFFQRRGIVVLASENFDGEWIAGIIRRFGYEVARGSTSRGAVRALVQMKRGMADGRAAAFSVDGPRGPVHVVQPGAVWLAKATGHPILPFHVEARRAWTLASWDGAQIPRPFSDLVISFAAPMYVPADADEGSLETARQELEATLHGLMARCAAVLQSVGPVPRPRTPGPAAG